MPMEERIAKVFDEVFGVESKDFRTDMATTDVPNWDSIGHMNLVMVLEQQFEQQFDVDEIMEMSSPAKIIEILKRRGVEG